MFVMYVYHASGAEIDYSGWWLEHGQLDQSSSFSRGQRFQFIMYMYVYIRIYDKVYDGQRNYAWFWRIYTFSAPVK
jgi:hypothetical protein